MFSDKNFKIFVSIIKYNMLKSEERELVYDAIKESSDNEKSMFMIQQDWWNSWVKYVDQGGCKPGKISNTEFLHGFEIKPAGHKLISRLAWNILKNIYDGKPEIEIFIINNVPDFSPINIYIQLPNFENFEFFLVSKEITVQELVNNIAKKKNLLYENLTIWMKNKCLNENLKLNEAGIQENTNLVMRGDSKALNETERITETFNETYAYIMNIDDILQKVNEAYKLPKQILVIKDIKEIKLQIDALFANFDNLDL